MQHEPMRLNLEDPGDQDAGGILSFGGGQTGGHLKHNPAEKAAATTKLAQDAAGSTPAEPYIVIPLYSYGQYSRGLRPAERSRYGPI